MEKFVSTLFTIILVFYVLSFVMRLTWPWILKFILKRVGKKMGMDTSAFFGDTTQGDPEPEAKRTRRKVSDFYLKPHRREGQSLSDLLGGEYTAFEEV